MISFERKDNIIMQSIISDDDLLKLVVENSPSKVMEIRVSEPFIGTSKQVSDILILYSSRIQSDDNIIGNISCIYSMKEFITLVNESVQGIGSSSILLTDFNTIVAVSEKPWMTGKNILKFRGEEHEIYNIVSSSNSSITNYKELILSKSSVRIPNTESRWSLITSIPVENVAGKPGKAIYLFIVLIIVIMILGLIIIVRLIGHSFKPLSELLSLLKRVSEGEPVAVSGINTQPEFNEMILYIARISDSITEILNYSHALTSGDFNKKIISKNEKDVLTKAVNSISSQLERLIIEVKLKEENTDLQLWMRKGRFEVAEAERVSSGKSEDLAFNIIRSIVNYTGAVMGGLYLYDEDLEIAEFVAAYAFGNRKMIKKQFRKGEGLVGTCIIERKKIELDKVPDDYLKISTGLGSGTPQYLLIMPVFFQSRINSVLEIAFIKRAEDYVIDFIEQLSESIGGWMDASSKKNKTIELLEISTKQTKLLAEKEEELKAKIDELQNIQNEMALKNAEYESILRAVNHSVMTVKYTIDGILLEANEVYVRTMGYSVDELIGINIFELVKGKENDLRKTIKRVQEGETVTNMVERTTKQGDIKQLSATYTPYIGPDNIIKGVLFFAVEIFHARS
jgi:PAS domain S-box-containing protein